MKHILLDEMDFEEAIRIALEAARQGALMLFPTDTVYGIGGQAFSRQVMEKLRRVKPEREAKPTAVLIDNIVRMSQCASDVPGRRIVALAEAYWPGPLTLVWKTSNAIPEEFQTADRSLGYRVPNHPFLLELLRRLETPLWATSANSPGQPPPKLFSEIKSHILEACDLVFETRILISGKSSTVVDVRGREPVVVRESGVHEEEIRRVWRTA
ncbi:threonylcarbamoyl-AMP synthase [bacterium]|nr:threonylcarbamoyl-AMP synthase [bacterium]MBU1983733.1 threonylcarbamoyl-AMP synthase [bacterium]